MIQYNSKFLESLTVREYNRLMRDCSYTLQNWSLHNVSELNRAWSIYVGSKQDLIDFRDNFYLKR